MADFDAARAALDASRRLAEAAQDKFAAAQRAARVRRPDATPHAAPATRARPRLATALARARADEARLRESSVGASADACQAGRLRRARRSTQGDCVVAGRNAGAVVASAARDSLQTHRVGRRHAMSCGCESIRMPARSTPLKPHCPTSKRRAAASSGWRRGRPAASTRSGGRRGATSSRATASAVRRGS